MRLQVILAVAFLSTTSLVNTSKVEVTSQTEEKQAKIVITAEEDYLLTKLAMAEAEGEDTKGKALVIQTVLNRVASDEFPDTIKEVIFEDGQFSPISDGRYFEQEPNDDCDLALEMVLNHETEEYEMLYFTSSTEKGNWFDNNLEKLFEYGNHTFYR